MSDDETKYTEYVSDAYEKAIRVVGCQLESGYLKKYIEKNDDNYDKMILIIFKDILRQYDKKAFDK